MYPIGYELGGYLYPIGYGNCQSNRSDYDEENPVIHQLDKTEIMSFGILENRICDLFAFWNFAYGGGFDPTHRVSYIRGSPLFTVCGSLKHDVLKGVPLL